MDNEADQIFIEQLEKLPSTVVDFISSTDWDSYVDEIGSLYNLSEVDLSDFKQEVTLVLAGLVHPDEFKETLEKEAGIEGPVLEALVANVENKIFAPIRPALVEFFEKEARNDAEQTQSNMEETPMAPVSSSVVSGQMSNVPRMPDVAPDNLPTNEESESFLPPLLPKNPNLETQRPSEEVVLPTHPFEEKMKKVFTAGQQSLGDLAIESSAPPLSGWMKPKPF